MSAFRISAAGLLRLATEGTLADRIAEQVWMSGHGVSPAERNSWSRSLSILAQDLADAGHADDSALDHADASAINHADQMHVAPLSVRWPDNGALFAVAIELCSLSPKYVRSAVAAMRVCLASACSRADESPALLTQRPP